MRKYLITMIIYPYRQDLGPCASCVAQSVGPQMLWDAGKSFRSVIHCVVGLVG